MVASKALLTPEELERFERLGAKIEKQLAEALGIPCRPWREYLGPAAPSASMAAAGAAQPLLALASR